jgi:hypothetical protein
VIHLPAMITLYDLLATTTGSKPERALGRQAGLSEQVVEGAMRALLPAFTAALNRMAETPEGARQILTLLGGSASADFYEQATAGLPEEMKTQGRDVLAKVFGSERVQHAIAAQAAAQSGVAEAVMQELMPAVATSLVEGLARQSAENPLLKAWLQSVDAWLDQSPAPRTETRPPEQRDLAEKLFATGLQVQEAQLRTFADIIDRAWGLERRGALEAGSAETPPKR